VIPPGRVSTVIAVSTTGPALNILSGAQLRQSILAFTNNSLALPAGLEFVDDLETATGDYSQ
jgi:hypothetical protein